MLSEAERRERVVRALEAAERCRRSRQYDQGIDLLIDALQHGTDKDKVYFRLGNLYFDRGRLDHAEYAYRRAIDANPTHVNAHHNLSVVYRKQQRWSESIKMRKTAASLARRHPDQVALGPEQIQHARRLARKTVIFAVLGIAVVLLLLLMLVQ